MDFAEGQEAVAVAAIFDEGGLKRRFDARYPGEIDISFELLLVLGLEVEFFDAVTADDDNPCFLRVGGIDKHFVGHYLFPSGRPSPAAARGECPAAVSLVECRIY